MTDKPKKSTFKEYYKDNFRLDDDGNICHIRKSCFQGNGKLESICEGNLNDIFNANAPYTEWLETRVEELEGFAHKSYDMIQKSKMLLNHDGETIEKLREALEKTDKRISRYMSYKCKCTKKCEMCFRCDMIKLEKLVRTTLRECFGEKDE